MTRTVSPQDCDLHAVGCGGAGSLGTAGTLRGENGGVRGRGGGGGWARRAVRVPEWSRR